LHRVEIGVFELAVDLEAVIVDQCVHLVPERSADLLDLLHRVGDQIRRPHPKVLEAQVQDVALIVVAEAGVEGAASACLRTGPSARAEDPAVHLAPLPDDRLERHLGEDVPLEVDAGSDLGQFEAAAGEPEHAPFGDVEDVLVRRGA
jgi:hypothetical protein